MKQLIVNADESGSWFTVTLLILAGIQLFCLGRVAEILSRATTNPRRDFQLCHFRVLAVFSRRNSIYGSRHSLRRLRL
jgi:hypothetical protein